MAVGEHAAAAVPAGPAEPRRRRQMGADELGARQALPRQVDKRASAAARQLQPSRVPRQTCTRLPLGHVYAGDCGYSAVNELCRLGHVVQEERERERERGFLSWWRERERESEDA